MCRLSFVWEIHFNTCQRFILYISIKSRLRSVKNWRVNSCMDAGIWPQGDCGGPDAVVCVGFRQLGSPADVLHHAVEFVDTDWSCIVPNFVIVFPVLLRILKKCIAFRVKLRQVNLHGFVTVVFFSGFVPSLVSKKSANFIIFSLFLRISEICFLTPYSADKLVPFSPFSKRTIIDCLSFIERTDHLCFKDVMIINKRSWR